MADKTLSALLLICAAIPALLAVATLLPMGSLVESDLGYKSLCPFAPWSTLILLFFTWLALAVRRYLASGKPPGARGTSA